MPNRNVYFPEFRMYKPQKSGTGAASAIQMVMKEVKGRYETQLFLIATQQIPSTNENAAFAWKEKSKTVTIKLRDPDIGEILAVLNGLKSSMGRLESPDKPGKGLYHQSPAGSTTMTLQSYRNEKSGELSYSMRLAAKNKAGVLTEVKHQLTLGEAQIVKLLLEHYVVASYGWNGQLPVSKKVEQGNNNIENF